MLGRVHDYKNWYRQKFYDAYTLQSILEAAWIKSSIVNCWSFITSLLLHNGFWWLYMPKGWLLVFLYLVTRCVSYLWKLEIHLTEKGNEGWALVIWILSVLFHSHACAICRAIFSLVWPGQVMCQMLGSILSLKPAPGGQFVIVMWYS